MTDLTTEKVTENYRTPDGNMASQTLWIAYPPTVAAYGSMDDRISRAWGRGSTQAQARAAAEVTS